MGKVTEIFGLTVVVLSLSCVSVEPSTDNVDPNDDVTGLLHVWVL